MFDAWSNKMANPSVTVWFDLCSRRISFHVGPLLSRSARAQIEYSRSTRFVKSILFNHWHEVQVKASSLDGCCFVGPRVYCSNQNRARIELSQYIHPTCSVLRCRAAWCYGKYCLGLRKLCSLALIVFISSFMMGTREELLGCCAFTPLSPFPRVEWWLQGKCTSTRK